MAQIFEAFSEYLNFNKKNKVIVNLPGIVWTAIANKWIVMKRPYAIICAIIAEGGIT